MSAAKYDLIIEQGSDFALQMIMSEDGSVKDLTGYTGRGQIRAPISNDSITASFTVTIGSPASAGIINVSLSSLITTALTPGLYFYDIELIISGVVTRLIQGKAEVTAEVTR